MKRIGYRSILCASLLCMAPSARGQLDAPPDELAGVSYIYAAVMGTGTYKIQDRRISMLRVPLAWSLRDLTAEQWGIKLHVPVVLGYDALAYPDWLSRFLEDDLVTLTVLPGLEMKRQLGKHWVLKPFANLGAGYDFTRKETISMGMLGIRGLATWSYEDQSELRVGTSYRYAYEYQIQAERFADFTMFEGGVDYRRDTHLNLFDRDVNAGVDYRFQLFLPAWRFDDLPPEERAQLGLIHEIGVSTGFQRSFHPLGIPISRIRLGYKFGDGIEGWTLGTEFPF
jgi:hypothetical protein